MPRGRGGDRKRVTSPGQTMWQARQVPGGRKDEKLPVSGRKDNLQLLVTCSIVVAVAAVAVAVAVGQRGQLQQLGDVAAAVVADDTVVLWLG